MRSSILCLVSIFFFIQGCSRDEDVGEVDTTESVEISINADHATDEIEFRLRRSIAGTEDLIFLYAENDWSTEELERQLLEKIDKLMLLYLENEWDMQELEKKLADLDRQLEAL
jgi:hypothetical protein